MTATINPIRCYHHLSNINSPTLVQDILSKKKQHAQVLYLFVPRTVWTAGAVSFRDFNTDGDEVSEYYKIAVWFFAQCIIGLPPSYSSDDGISAPQTISLLHIIRYNDPDRTVAGYLFRIVSQTTLMKRIDELRMLKYAYNQAGNVTDYAMEQWFGPYRSCVEMSVELEARAELKIEEEKKQEQAEEKEEEEMYRRGEEEAKEDNRPEDVIEREEVLAHMNNEEDEPMEEEENRSLPERNLLALDEKEVDLLNTAMDPIALQQKIAKLRMHLPARLLRVLKNNPGLPINRLLTPAGILFHYLDAATQRIAIANGLAVPRARNARVSAPSSERNAFQFVETLTPKLWMQTVARVVQKPSIERHTTTLLWDIEVRKEGHVCNPKAVFTLQHAIQVMKHHVNPNDPEVFIDAAYLDETNWEHEGQLRAPFVDHSESVLLNADEGGMAFFDCLFPVTPVRLSRNSEMHLRSDKRLAFSISSNEEKQRMFTEDDIKDSVLVYREHRQYVDRTEYIIDRWKQENKTRIDFAMKHLPNQDSESITKQRCQTHLILLREFMTVLSSSDLEPATVASVAHFKTLCTTQKPPITDNLSVFGDLIATIKLTMARLFSIDDNIEHFFTKLTCLFGVAKRLAFHLNYLSLGPFSTSKSLFAWLIEMCAPKGVVQQFHTLSTQWLSGQDPTRPASFNTLNIVDELPSCFYDEGGHNEDQYTVCLMSMTMDTVSAARLLMNDNPCTQRASIRHNMAWGRHSNKLKIQLKPAGRDRFFICEFTRPHNAGVSDAAPVHKTNPEIEIEMTEERRRFFSFMKALYACNFIFCQLQNVGLLPEIDAGLVWPFCSQVIKEVTDITRQHFSYRDGRRLAEVLNCWTRIDLIYRAFFAHTSPFPIGTPITIEHFSMFSKCAVATDEHAVYALSVFQHVVDDSVTRNIVKKIAQKYFRVYCSIKEAETSKRDEEAGLLRPKNGSCDAKYYFRFFLIDRRVIGLVVPDRSSSSSVAPGRVTGPRGKTYRSKNKMVPDNTTQQQLQAVTYATINQDTAMAVEDSGDGGSSAYDPVTMICALAKEVYRTDKEYTEDVIINCLSHLMHISIPIDENSDQQIPIFKVVNDEFWIAEKTIQDRDKYYLLDTITTKLREQPNPRQFCYITNIPNESYGRLFHVISIENGDEKWKTDAYYQEHRRDQMVKMDDSNELAGSNSLMMYIANPVAADPISRDIITSFFSTGGQADSKQAHSSQIEVLGQTYLGDLGYAGSEKKHKHIDPHPHMSAVSEDWLMETLDAIPSFSFNDHPIIRVPLNLYESAMTAARQHLGGSTIITRCRTFLAQHFGFDLPSFEFAITNAKTSNRKLMEIAMNGDTGEMGSTGRIYPDTIQTSLETQRNRMEKKSKQTRKVIVATTTTTTLNRTISAPSVSSAMDQKQDEPSTTLHRSTSLRDELFEKYKAQQVQRRQQIANDRFQSRYRMGPRQVIQIEGKNYNLARSESAATTSCSSPSPSCTEMDEEEEEEGPEIQEMV